MDKLQKQVQEFHREVIGGLTSPAKPELRDAFRRASLIAEEAAETVFALVGNADAQSILVAQMLSVLNLRTRAGKHKADVVEAIDGCIDTIIVSYGTLEAIGVDGEPFADEVMRTNMAKKGGKIDANGKLQKPAGWTPPDIAGVLEKVK